MRRHPFWFAVTFGLLLIAAIAPPAQANERDLLERLRSGELVVYFRHGDTRSGAGSVARLEGCEGERNLSDVGRAEMREVREAFRAIGAEISDVLSSPLCRARETALIGFGRVEPTDILRSLLGHSADDTRSLETLRLFSSPEAGSIRIMVAHQSNLSVPLGIDLEEGEAAILAPSETAAGPPRILARLMPNEWLELVSGR